MPNDKALLEQVNNEYESYQKRWTFWNDSLRGGEDFLDKDYLIAHPRESEDANAFLFRKQFSVYESFGHNIATDYISRLFGPGVEISLCQTEDEDRSKAEYFEEIEENADLLGSTFNNVVRNAIYLSAGLGMSAVVCDVAGSGDYVSLEEALQGGARPYIRTVYPQNILDWEYDSRGQLEWVKIRERASLPRTWNQGRDLYRELQPTYRYFVMDRGRIIKFEPTAVDMWQETIIPHGLGYVPFKAFYWAPQEPGLMFQPSILQEIYRFQFLVYQVLSGIGELIENQCFSIFVIAAGLGRNKDNELRVGTRRALRVPGGEGFPPFFASPDPELPRVHLDYVEHLIKSIKRMSKGVGMTMVDEGNVKEASGRSKAYDVDGLTNLLREAGDHLEPAILGVQRMIHDRSPYGEEEFTGTAKLPDSHILRGVLEEAEEASAACQVLEESPLALKLIKQRFANTVLRSSALPEQLSDVYEEIKGTPLDVSPQSLEENNQNGTNTAVERGPTRAEQPGRDIRRIRTVG